MTSAARRAALQGYLSVLRDRCRLQIWDIGVVEQDAVEDAALDTLPDPRLHWARVRVGSFFSEDGITKTTPEEQRRIAVHEILHLPQGPLLHYLDHGSWAVDLSPGQAAAIKERIVNEIETVTDLYARMLSPYLPLPPNWPDDA